MKQKESMINHCKLSTIKKQVRAASESSSSREEIVNKFSSQDISDN